jgi:hypothetical protein
MELKPLSRDAIPAALAKAERYRLLNEPAEAESICLDILAVESEHQEALVTLLLSLTDQFDSDALRVVHLAQETVGRLRDAYEHAYYTGIIAERRAKAHLAHGTAGSGAAAYEWLRDAMRHFERAQSLRPAGNDDSILRWNACARWVMSHPELQPVAEERGEPLMLE